MSLLQVLLAILPVTILQTDEGEGEVNLSCDNIISSNFILKQVANHIQMLKGFLVKVWVDRAVHGIVAWFKVLLDNELLPDLSDFGEVASRFGI